MKLALSKLEKNLLRMHSLVGRRLSLAGYELLYTDRRLTSNFVRWEHTKRYTQWGLVGASYLWADWLAVGASLPILRWLRWVYE